MPSDAPGVHLYGFIPAERIYTPTAAGVAGSGLRCVVDGAVAAIVGPPSPDGYIGARRELTAHTAALEEALRETQAVAPARFGVVTPDGASVVETLIRPQAERIEGLLEAVDGQFEMTLKGYWIDEAAFAAILRENPAIAVRRAAIAGRGEAETYYERIALGQAVAVALAARSEAMAAGFATALKGAAMATDTLPLAGEPQAFGAALRVARAREAAVDAAVEAFCDQWAATVRFKYVGPSPLFHFLAEPMAALG